MATDNFWLNPDDEEEKERQKQHQLLMGVMPTALPPTAPFGGGIGLSNYKGKYGPYVAPLPFEPKPIDPNESFTIRQVAGPTVNKFTPLGSDYTPQQLNTPVEKLQQQNIPQNVIPITPTDTTLAGMATVPFTGMESSFGAGTKVAAGPGWGFNISPDSIGLSYGTPKDLATQEATGGISWPEKPTVQELPPELPTRTSGDWLGNMGIYDDLISKKAAYDMGPGHPTVLKELVKTLEDQRNVDVTPGPTAEEVEAIIETAISAPTGNLERIAIAKAANKRAQDLARQKQAAANKRAADRTNAARQKSDAAARAKQQELAKKAFDALMVGRDRGEPSSAEINAAIEVMSGVDTFGSGGQIDRMGPSGGYGGEVGGRDTGGGYHGR